jgi:hypothetical protein
MFSNFRLRWRQLATRTWVHSGSFPFLLDRMRALQEAWEKFENEKADFERWMLKGGGSTTSLRRRAGGLGKVSRRPARSNCAGLCWSLLPCIPSPTVWAVLMIPENRLSFNMRL